MKIEVTAAEMLAMCHIHIAIADNMSLIDLETKAVNAIKKQPRNLSHVATAQNIILQAETTA